jgi:hypothetical protein
MYSGIRKNHNTLESRWLRRVESNEEAEDEEAEKAKAEGYTVQCMRRA